MASPEDKLKNVNLLLGVSGGIAAYKSVDLGSKLTSSGASVRTIMTGSAQQFVCPKSFESVCRQPVYTSLWTTNEQFTSTHTSFTEWADIVVIAPATADIIAKIAAGICDDLLTTTACACWEKPILLAPAMNDKMWANPIVRRNTETVKKQGMKIAGPAAGRLACGDEGEGRMLEPEQIVEEIIKLTE